MLLLPAQFRIPRLPLHGHEPGVCLQNVLAEVELKCSCPAVDIREHRIVGVRAEGRVVLQLWGG